MSATISLDLSKEMLQILSTGAYPVLGWYWPASSRNKSLGCIISINRLTMQELEDYAPLPDDLVGSAKRWQEWMELERPEDEPLPGDWKRMPEFERLLIFRTLRPDRLTAAMQRFVANTIGKEYTASQPYDLERSFEVNISCLHTCIILYPGW